MQAVIFQFESLPVINRHFSVFALTSLLCVAPALADMTSGMSRSSSMGGSGASSSMRAARAAELAKRHPGMASSYMQSGKGMPFGGVNAARQTGKRPEEIAPPTQSECALKEQAGRLNSGSTRQDAAGRVHVFNEGALKEKRAEISAGCSLTAGPGFRPPVSGKSKKPVSVWDKRSNTLKAARDGYVGSSIGTLTPGGASASAGSTASMAALKSRKPQSVYDPVLGGVRPPKALSNNSIYQQP